MFDSERIGKEMTAIRKRRGLTQEEVATRLNVSPQAVSKWENGRAMPELSLLAELVGVLGCTVDELLFPSSRPAAAADFEHNLLPYAPIADFSGRDWPRSIAYPAILSAVKLFMGLEEHRDSMGRQINDDTEYILQSAYTSMCVGYSWGPEDALETGLAAYGLTGKLCSKNDYSQEDFIRLAANNILSGYPVIILPKEYSDMILATGFSGEGKILKGVPFLDGDDEKNAVMSFQQLKSFPEWYAKEPDMLLIQPGSQTIPTADMCKEGLQKMLPLLRNETHISSQPLEGYGLVIYDNWCSELQQESNQNLINIECLFPHCFIHYEGKLRIKEFLEFCLRHLPDVNSQPLVTAISKYEEMLRIWEKCMNDMSEKGPETAEEAKAKRQVWIAVLQRSKELEIEALSEMASIL